MTTPEVGLIIRYSYLWLREARSGREEGAKDRPCAVVLTMQDDADDRIVFALPITHTPPSEDTDAIEIPLATKQRLGLDGARSWIILNEVNRFVWPGPDLRPVSGKKSTGIAYGQLPPRFFAEVRRRWLICYEAQRMKMVRRTE